MNLTPRRSYKEKRTFEQRYATALEIRRKYPNKIPVIVERFKCERQLPLLDKNKYLVPDYLTVAEFLVVIRRRLQLNPTQAIFLLVNQKCVPSCSMTMSHLYQYERDSDGFVYMTFASQDVFGSSECARELLHH